jgi:drug/metabolite transporter (DMT)-like permease
MIWLLLSIVSSTLLYVCFKLFEKYEIPNDEAIFYNYITATALGIYASSGKTGLTEVLNEPWIFHAIILGILFIVSFNLIGITVRKLGMSVATVANKMSLVIPVMIGVYLFQEKMDLIKSLGIILALIAIVMISFQPSSKKGARRNYYVYLLPLLIFLWSGGTDAFIKYIQTIFINDSNRHLFVSFVFITAGIASAMLLFYGVIKDNRKLKAKSILWGVLLGFPNYGSMYFLVRALESGSMESSVIFPINNMLIVALSSVIAYLFFKERISILQLFGILVSMLAILVISFA